MTGEGAARLYRHAKTVLRWLAQGNLRGYRLPGGYRRVPLEALGPMRQSRGAVR